MTKIVYNGETDPRLCKDVIGATVASLADGDSDVIFLDADLMSCSGTLKWSKTHGDRAIDCGIAEANMAGVAAGLAAAGFKPIIHSFGTFASRRIYDQIDTNAMYTNCLTSTVVRSAMLPPVMANDREAIQFCIRTCNRVTPESLRMIRIHNSLHLGSVMLSAAYLADVRAGRWPGLEDLEDPAPLAFNADGDLDKDWM